MSKLKKIWLNSMSGPSGDIDEIRVDWDNDRHQAVRFEKIDSDGVIDGLRKLIYLLESEKAGGHL